ncbi:hypothetical protein SAMN05421542_2607 [Chryseobacterium jejuense]|uniref:Uncharacterized protein n=1 Tax=Chryseobacterium jejuense TaxID=445960 RepID=A0A2X2VHG5_CHRJE|nr:hypothetical protein SAMN05421542_2607 [Chryseobacterium jejuense]SQB27844.1 Uncharacterised protein [Chryseobacterium jejuense]
MQYNTEYGVQLVNLKDFWNTLDNTKQLTNSLLLSVLRMRDEKIVLRKYLLEVMMTFQEVEY